MTYTMATATGRRLNLNEMQQGDYRVKNMTFPDQVFFRIGANIF